MDIDYKVQREMIRRGYSVRTIKTYLDCIHRFFKKCNKHPSKVSKVEVREFLNDLTGKGVAGNTINVYLNALKFLFEQILNKKMRLNIRYSKIPKRLPVVLTKEEIRRLIDSIENDKHRLIVKLMYSAGLRVSELANLRVRDLEFENNFGWVREGKGKKDRMFIIAKSVKDDLLEFVKDRGRDSWVFLGNNGRHISQRTVAAIIKDNTKKSKIEKNVHCHTLRHSFATHLIEDGYDVSSVQSLLGHNSSQTTMIYVHIASPKMINVKSPLDNL